MKTPGRAVEAGFADPKRGCIGGSSYGGYATLRALTKTPDLFACGWLAWWCPDRSCSSRRRAPISRAVKSAVVHWRSLIGEKGSGWEQSKAVSPAFQLDRLEGAAHDLGRRLLTGARPSSSMGRWWMA